MPPGILCRSDRLRIGGGVTRVGLTIAILSAAICAVAAEPAAPAGGSSAKESSEEPASKLVALNPEQTVFFDKDRKLIQLKARVCLREGVLEMFLCPRQTKEHESILSLDAKAHVIHAGLLAAGATPGRPVRYQPEFAPPEGQRIDIFVNWLDERGQPQRRRAQEWVRHATHQYFEAPLAAVPAGVPIDEGDDSLRYDRMNKLLLWFGTMTPEQRDTLLGHSDQKEYQEAVESLFEQGKYRQLEAEFVFAGSAFTTTEDGRKLYLAESGSVICVANFGDALIDVNISSTASDDAGRLFEPWTERIPPVGTPVTVELIPVGAESETTNSAPDGSPPKQSDDSPSADK